MSLAHWLNQRRAYYRRGDVETRTVTSAGDFAALMALRSSVYQQAGKATDAYPFPLEHLDDTFRVVTFHDQNELVGSVVIHIPPFEDNSLKPYPKDLPPRQDCIEMTRLFFKKEYRGTDLIKEVYRQGILALAQTKRTYILLSADERLKQKYSRIRFRDTGHRPRDRNGKSGDLALMVARLRWVGFYGITTRPLLWNLFLFDPLRDLIRTGDLPVWHLFLYAPYLVLRPFAWLFEQGYLMQLRRAA